MNEKIMANETALGRFVGAIAEIQERLAELTAYADNHMNYSCDSIDYGLFRIRNKPHYTERFVISV